jgi:hypothetical protein
MKPVFRTPVVQTVVVAHNAGNPLGRTTRQARGQDEDGRCQAGDRRDDGDDPETVERGGTRTRRAFHSRTRQCRRQPGLRAQSRRATPRTVFGHHNRVGGGPNPTSWNSAYPSKGCSQENLRGTGGDGLFYCSRRNDAVRVPPEKQARIPGIEPAPSERRC